ncbi:stalk domain-containing protein [Pseudobacteroides cellulosolvens]|uniref:PBP domain containing protein n=1 Tax=Pseudobacteroides cellulosolvens ATCC 35603 = DSM 2933 TaxID=398512 RepID=A0A0L6JP80_9FIRM|nr:substrate-binding domain-containing protein [Pseudobacteroides cellulosolvens]KNY27646.1 PBP domain containing protein [Pseudobacteroides cellulosolvens ATCC 35603 = DSM 2933]
MTKEKGLTLLLIISYIVLIISAFNFADLDNKGGSLNLFIDGEKVADDKSPIINDGTIYLPAKTICEYLGADYEFNEEEYKVSIHMADRTVELAMDMPYADINGKVVELTKGPINIDGVVMLPSDMVKVSFDAEVISYDSNKSVNIKYFSLMSGTLRMGGASAFINISQRAIDKLKKLSPKFDARVFGGGSSAGITACLDGQFDIANITRELSADEIYYNADIKSYRVAKEGIAVIINNQNKINDLNRDQICKLFEGKYLSWRAAMGDDNPVYVNVQEAGTGTSNTFYDIGILKVDEFGEYARTAMPNSSNGLVRQAVASEPLAVGFVTFPFLNETVKAVSIEGVRPDKDSVIKKKWPLVNKLNLVTNGDAKGLKAKYINFLRSKAGRKIIEEEGFINLDYYYKDEIES